MPDPSHKLALVLITGCLASADVWAQTDLVTTPPPNLVIANYNSTSVGPYGGLEGTAYVARVDDPSAAWFNPAGLSRQARRKSAAARACISARSWRRGRCRIRAGRSSNCRTSWGLRSLPREGLTVGAALLSTNAWDQETDSELFSPTAAGQQRFAYSADSGFEQRVAAVGVGYRPTGSWRVGAGFAFSMMNLRLVQSVSDRIADTSGLRSLLVSSRARAPRSSSGPRAACSTDAGHWRLGGAFRSPGADVSQVGRDFWTASWPASPIVGSLDFRSGRATRVPPAVGVSGRRGVCHAPRRAGVRPPCLHADRRVSVALVRPARAALRRCGSERAASVTSRPFAGLTSESDGIVNVSAGGHVRLLKDRDLRVHAGIGSNRSPVAPSDVVFNKVDLTTWSVGVSGTFGNFQFAVGINRQRGSADDVTLRNLLNGQEVHSPIDIHLVGSSTRWGISSEKVLRF